MRATHRLLWTIGVVMTTWACKEEKHYHDQGAASVPAAASPAVKEIIDFQEAKNALFRNPEKSPLPDRYRMDFQGLDFFPPDTQYILKARLVRTPEALPFLMPTTTERKTEQQVYGIAHFNLHGRAHQLEIYQKAEAGAFGAAALPKRLFLPFSDGTNGRETYGGGRYIDLLVPEGDTLVLDFNRAYNPYCAYNKKYSCPLVPAANRLDTEIRAGERKFEP